MELAVYNTEGKKTSKKVKLNDAIFGIEPNDHAIWLDVKRIRAAMRQGTHKAKHRGEIAGSTRKIKKQKGTGTARAGSIKNPLFRGGGRVFGPQPRDYSIKVNKKVVKLAKRSALSYKAKENAITVLEDFSFETPRTKEYAALLKNLEVNGKKTLMILAGENRNVELSSRNIPSVKVVIASELNTYDILNAGSVLLVQSSVDQIENALS